MLGRTYAMMQRFNEAKEAYEKVLALSPDNPEVLTDYADIVAMTHDGSLLVSHELEESPASGCKEPKGACACGYG